MSQGRLVAQGSSAELKDKFGGGYRVTLQADHVLPPSINGITPTRDGDANVYSVYDSAEACEVITQLEAMGYSDAGARGPDMQDVFLNLASPGDGPLFDPQFARDPWMQPSTYDGCSRGAAHNHDEPGKGSGFWKQLVLIFTMKRLAVARRNYMPYICAIAVPLLTAGLAGSYFLNGFKGIPCSRGAIKNDPETLNFAVLQAEWGIQVPVGPADSGTLQYLPSAYQRYRNHLRPVGSFEAFENYIADNFRDVVPGGYYLGANGTALPLMAYRINGNTGYAALAKNLADQVLSRVR